MPLKNLPELLCVQSDRLGNATAIRYKQSGLYYDITWNQYWETVQAVAAQLLQQGICPGDRVGLLGENSPQWLMADMAILLSGAVTVPPHAPLTAQQVLFQFRNTDVRWIFVSNVSQYNKIEPILDQLPSLKGVVVLSVSQSQPNKYLSWTSFVNQGYQILSGLDKQLEERYQSLNETSLATIMYTSGTTGNPKGVMLTHGNLLSNAAAVNESFPRTSTSVVLNWLPFSHIYARTVDHYLNLITGAVVCLAESAETVVDNLREIHPTHISCVPRFYEKVMTAVEDSDPEVTKKRLRAIFGPRMEWLASGGAPLPVSLAEKYRDGGYLILQGYGLTESSPVISFNHPDRYKLESVGQAIPGVEIRIADDGEILTRGPHVMPGYWDNSQATNEAIQDGWLYTGDLGTLDEDGFLHITGRKKELLVLSNGKKIIPTTIEGLLVSDVSIDQAIVYGEGKNYLTALIVPNWDHIKSEVNEPDLVAKSYQELTENDSIITYMRNRMDRLLAELSNSEQIKRFILLPEPFSIEKEELTVSMKLRRNVIVNHHERILNELYSS